MKTLHCVSVYKGLRINALTMERRGDRVAFWGAHVRMFKKMEMLPSASDDRAARPLPGFLFWRSIDLRWLRILKETFRAAPHQQPKSPRHYHHGKGNRQSHEAHYKTRSDTDVDSTGNSIFNIWGISLNNSIEAFVSKWRSKYESSLLTLKGLFVFLLWGF